MSKAHIRPEVLASHGNARTTVLGRMLIVDRHRAGLEDRSSRPHTSPTRTLAEVEDQIVTTRSSERRGPAWIGAELGLPARTVSPVLVRRGSRRSACGVHRPVR